MAANEPDVYTLYKIYATSDPRMNKAVAGFKFTLNYDEAIKRPSQFETKNGAVIAKSCDFICKIPEKNLFMINKLYEKEDEAKQVGTDLGIVIFDGKAIKAISAEKEIKFIDLKDILLNVFDATENNTSKPITFFSTFGLSQEKNDTERFRNSLKKCKDQSEMQILIKNTEKQKYVSRTFSSKIDAVTTKLEKILSYDSDSNVKSFRSI